MTTPIRPTREARRLHLSHLATTHRTPLSGRRPTGVRTRGALVPMARDHAARDAAGETSPAGEDAAA